MKDGRMRRIAALSRRDQKIARLYEQGASKERVGAYLRRWLGWAGVGILGILLLTGCVSNQFISEIKKLNYDLVLNSETKNVAIFRMAGPYKQFESFKSIINMDCSIYEQDKFFDSIGEYNWFKYIYNAHDIKLECKFQRLVRKREVGSPVTRGRWEYQKYELKYENEDKTVYIDYSSTSWKYMYILFRDEKIKVYYSDVYEEWISNIRWDRPKEIIELKK